MNENENTTDARAMPPASDGYAVGDCLAFHGGLGRGRWEIHKITKVTPSGRLTCGPYTLNPDLTVRGIGDCWHSAPHRAEPVTEAIIVDIRRRKAMEFIRGFDWSKLDVDSLESVVAVAKQA